MKTRTRRTGVRNSGGNLRPRTGVLSSGMASLKHILLILLCSAASTAQDVTATMAMGKPEFVSGEPIYVTFSVRNDSGSPRWVSNDDCGQMSIQFELLAGPKQPLGDPLFGCPLGFGGSCFSSRTPIGSRETYRYNYLVRVGSPLTKPGTYRIRARRFISVASTARLQEALANFETTSELTFQIREARPGELVAIYKSLEQAAHAKEWATSNFAVQALAEKPPEQLESFFEQEADSNDFNAYWAIRALEKIDTTAAHAKLAALFLHGRSDSLKQNALIALARSGDPDYCELMKNINEPVPYNNDVATEAMARMCGKSALPILKKKLASGDPAQQRPAILALGASKMREAVPLLIDMLMSSDESIRRESAIWLGNLTHHVQATEALRRESKALYQDYIGWWSSHGAEAHIYGAEECSGLQ